MALSGTLYLPAGYVAGTRCRSCCGPIRRSSPSASAAGQVRGSPYRFTRSAEPSHLLLLTQGYAILDDPTMPIVGEGETANDTYVEQLVASAQAAVDAVVAEGVADRDRIAVGGHSYGAFMTANLLAHSRPVPRRHRAQRRLQPHADAVRLPGRDAHLLGSAARSTRACRRSGTPHKINEPILLIHGEADNNSGTFPIQSERLYMALKGNGATVRYVTLPHEAHGYAARESVLHTVAEMLDWLDSYVKNAAPRAPAPSAP